MALVACADVGANGLATSALSALSYPVVDTGQVDCFNAGAATVCGAPGSAFYGQDAQVVGAGPSYVVHDDGTVSDLVTGLMWQRDPGPKMTFYEASAGAASFDLAGYDDWRLPTIKELYSLMRFDGQDISGPEDIAAVPFIDDEAFVFSYGDTSAGERAIDSQWATSTVYTGTVMGGISCMFGVNFADGRIKCYPLDKTFFTLYVRGAAYGDNAFVDGSDGTVFDAATGLTWQQGDSGAGADWQGALAYCEALTLGGADDWRLPDAKELQSIVDYGRSPDATGSAALDPVFGATAITNEAGPLDWPAYWSSSTHESAMAFISGANAAYVCFGRCMGYFMGQWQDVHGAGAQRSDPKVGSSASYPYGHGPQGDAVRVDNFVRCVRGPSQPPSCPDGDSDGVCDADDACPQGDDAQDADDDEVPDACDLCPGGDDDEDGDEDGVADACDACPADPADDVDGDGVCGDVDNCEATSNAEQADGDEDGVGDACDPVDDSADPPDASDEPVMCMGPRDCRAPEACPDGAVSCGCRPTPEGRQCVPLCDTNADCAGLGMRCGPRHVCVEKGPRRSVGPAELFLKR